MCTTKGIAIPWDDVAQLMGGLLGKPTMTGEAIKQHMAKLHKARQEGHQPVPPKLDRNQRRRAATYAAAKTGSDQVMPPPPLARPANNKGKRQGKLAPPSTPIKPGPGLLFEKPNSSTSKKPKLGLQTPVSTTGRNKTIKDVADGDDCFALGPKIPAPIARGSKRGGKSKTIGHRDESVIDGTPTKKPRARRAPGPKNYAEAPPIDEDFKFDPNIVNSQPRKSTPQPWSFMFGMSLTIDTASSQNSTMFDQAPPHFGSAHASPEQPTYEVQPGMPPLPFHFVPQDNGLPPTSMHEFNIFGGHGHIPRYVDFGNQGQYNQNLQAIVDANNQHARQQGNVDQDNFQAGWGGVQAKDFARANPQSGYNSQNTSPDHSAQVTRTNSQDFGGFYGNAKDLVNSPTETFGRGKTGITPNMAQYGFDDFGMNGNGTHINIQHNDSFDSGYGGFPADAAGENKLEFGIDDFVNFGD